MRKNDFISKWSNWWILQKNAPELNAAFESELTMIINQQIVDFVKFHNEQNPDKYIPSSEIGRFTMFIHD